MTRVVAWTLLSGIAQRITVDPMACPVRRPCASTLATEGSPLLHCRL
ncbi:MAG: hypothetical protein ACLRZL_10030 [Alistipes communis]